MAKELADTINLMTSADYKERFLAEYMQVSIRKEKLGQMLAKYKAGALEFTPTCPYELLHKQLVFMDAYMMVLRERAALEDISLDSADHE